MFNESAAYLLEKSDKFDSLASSRTFLNVFVFLMSFPVSGFVPVVKLINK